MYGIQMGFTEPEPIKKRKSKSQKKRIAAQKGKYKEYRESKGILQGYMEDNAPAAHKEVFILWRKEPWEGHELLGVFSSEEKAAEFAQSWMKTNALGIHQKLVTEIYKLDPAA